METNKKLDKILDEQLRKLLEKSMEYAEEINDVVDKLFKRSLTRVEAVIISSLLHDIALKNLNSVYEQAEEKEKDFLDIVRKALKQFVIIQEVENKNKNDNHE
ncbi:MAG: hypothetical protein ACOC1K_07975 [Nanoarchaeota archaeon]